jgi:uncharacterized membrane protein YgdD (TMEM256/DUF423 family)
MKSFIIICGITGAISVILGAFGAHALKELISPDQLVSYKTAVQYHQIHTLAMLMTAFFYKQAPSKLLQWVFYGFTIGVLFFSGSIYLLSCKDLFGISNTSLLGPITPIGGLIFICSWIGLAIAGYKK